MQKFTIALLTCLFFFTNSAPSYAMSQEQEIQIGAQAAAQFESQYGLINDPYYQGRLERVAQRMLPHVKRQDLPWRFRVVNIDAFNAAAFPGGFVYATKGLMDGLTDDELAFVVGHEMAHADLSHSVNQLESEQFRRLGLIAIVAGASGGRVNENVATAVQLVDGVISSQYSQGDESEADRYGLTLMGASGYDPAFALSALNKLAASSGGGTPGFLNTLLGSHPLPKDRVRQGVDLIPTIPYTAQAVQPVNAAPRTSSSSSLDLVTDAGNALEYSLSLLGLGHRDSLQRLAEQVALGQRGVPSGTSLIRLSGSRSQGFSNLEDSVFKQPGVNRRGQAFGAAVVDKGGDRIEAVVLLQGGR